MSQPSPHVPNPQAELDERLRFETLLADLSLKFINLPAGEVDREIMDAERRICELLDLDISAIWQWSAGPPGRFTLTHYYSAQDGPQPSMQLSDSDFPWFRQLMLERRVVPIASLDEMPAEAALDRENCRRLGVKSNLCLPLTVGGEPVGILGLNTTRAQRDWPDSLVKRLQLLAQVFTNALSRKRADETLRESEERLNLAVNSAQAGIWALNCSTQVFWVTEQARLIFGYSPEEMISLDRFKASVHPADWDFVQRSLNRSLETGEAVNVEYRIRLGDGRERWISSRGRPFFKPTGEPERLLGLSMDITERKGTEDQLRQLSLAVEQSPVSVVITDLKSNISYVNQKFTEVSGYSLAECVGQNPRILKSGECSPETYRELWVCITSGRTWRGEFHNRKKNGDLYWEWAVISPLLEATGKVTHFVGIKEDITERKRAEAAFRASESRLSAGTELAGLGYYEVDYGQGNCFMDERFRAICGVPPDLKQALQPVQFWAEHVHPDDCDFLLTERQKLHEGKFDRLSGEYRYLHPAQGEKWIHHLARVVGRSANGGGVRTFGVIRDITEAKRAEVETHELRDNLTHLTRVNTLGALSGSLAHELNQPLGIILSNAQAAQELLLQQPPDLAEMQAILTDIVAADRRAGEVIERLRALLKHGQVSLQPLALNQVIEEVLHLTRADLIGRGVSAICELAPDLPLIAGDRVQLQQLVLNLIINAADALSGNAPGTRQLVFQTRLHQNRVRASVRDEGSGLPTDVERLFKPFYTTKSHGLGMGLAICRSIVTAHNGRLWAETGSERGAVFHFELPVTDSQNKP